MRNVYTCITSTYIMICARIQLLGTSIISHSRLVGARKHEVGSGNNDITNRELQLSVHV